MPAGPERAMLAAAKAKLESSPELRGLLETEGISRDAWVLQYAKELEARAGPETPPPTVEEPALPPAVFNGARQVRTKRLSLPDAVVRVLGEEAKALDRATIFRLANERGYIDLPPGVSNKRMGIVVPRMKERGVLVEYDEAKPRRIALSTWNINPKELRP